MRFIFFFFLAVLLSSASEAATDSLIIKGRILNLNGRLYRQAPFITFSRNNIFRPQSELSKQAPLQADGSFTVSLPMVYQKEEIYLDYSGLAFATFLGSPGTVEITFNGDSLKTGQKLFFFAGVNAEANNKYYEYQTSENVVFKNNPALGTKFYDSFWQKDPGGALSAARSRADLRISALSSIASRSVPNPTLNMWVTALAEDERLQNMFEYVLSNGSQPGKLLDSLKRLATSPLTVQRVTMASRFGTYADRKTEEINFQNPSKTRSLPAKLMATLILDNVRNMTPDERGKVVSVRDNGVVNRSDLDFLSRMYAKNETVLNLLFDYERAVRTYGEIFDSTAVDFLKARYLTRNFFKFNPAQILKLNSHMQASIREPHFRASLDELVKLEIRDSAEIRKLVANRDIVTTPRELLPGYWFSASNDDGVGWLNGILSKYIGKTVYLIKWNMEDEKSRELLEYMPYVRAQLSENVVFLYVHSTFSDEIDTSKDLWKQYIYRHRLQGVHMSLNSSQTIDLLFKLNPMDAATFAIIKPNGKFFSKNAPAPADNKKLMEAIQQAGK